MELVSQGISRNLCSPLAWQQFRGKPLNTTLLCLCQAVQYAWYCGIILLCAVINTFGVHLIGACCQHPMMTVFC
jgi:hypothetical protein